MALKRGLNKAKGLQSLIDTGTVQETGAESKDGVIQVSIS